MVEVPVMVGLVVIAVVTDTKVVVFVVVVVVVVAIAGVVGVIAVVTDVRGDCGVVPAVLQELSRTAVKTEHTSNSRFIFTLPYSVVSVNGKASISLLYHKAALKA
jgi:hypothetical protein